MLASVVVCDECKPKIKVEDFLMPEGRARISAALDRMGMHLPDFSSAELDFEEIVGEPIDVTALALDAERRGQKLIEG